MNKSKIHKSEEPSGMKKEKLTNSYGPAIVARGIIGSDVNFQEVMIAIFLNRGGNTIGVEVVSIGGISSTVCDVRVILSAAITSGASSIILAHNEPSGNLKPTKSDLALTKKIKAGCQLLDLDLLDHLIIGKHHHHSMADECDI